MKIKRLGLKNYRNCTDVEIIFPTLKTLIIGKNAQGKTNILESIYFLSDLKSPRTSTISDLIQFDKPQFEINAELNKNETDIELNYLYTQEKKRELKINKVKTTPRNFKLVAKTVLFSTKDMLLLRGTPEDRRDWLDRAISQIYPAYDERLSKYDKIRIQKNNLLKQEIIDEALLDIYNEQLAVTGANIIYLRKKFLKEIETIAYNKHRTISETEEFSINYTCPKNDVEEINEYLKQEHDLVLGAMDGIQYHIQHEKKQKGDFIFLYTDGVTEALNKEQKLYGDANLKNTLNNIKNENLEVQSIISEVKNNLDEYTQGEEQADDITMLVLKYNGVNQVTIG